jgi:hypothetical protein
VRRSGAIAALVVFALAASASAQTDTDLATRRVLIDQARAASERGDHAQALDLAQRAAAVRMTPSLRQFIAHEQRATGDVATAFATSEACMHEAERDTTSARHDVIAADCRTLHTELQSLIGFLVVRVSDSNARVRVNGTPVNPALVGVPIVVTPGNVSVQVDAPGHSVFERTVPVAARNTATVVVAWDAAQSPREPASATVTSTPSASSPPGEAGPHSSAPTPADHATAAATATTQPAAAATVAPTRRAELVARPDVPARPSLVPPIAVMGVGVVAIGVGIGLVVAAGQPVAGCMYGSDHDVHCADMAAALAEQSHVGSLNVGADVTFAIGAVAVAAGATWLVIDLVRAPHDTPRVSLVPSPSGFSLQGVF